MRTVNEIREALRTAFLANAVLREAYGLDVERKFEEQFSAVSLEAQLTDLVARVVYDHEYLIEERMSALDAKTGSRIPFTPPWYIRKALEFQLGDAVAFNPATNLFEYPAVSGDKRIIRHVAVRDVAGNGSTTLYIFVAKEGRTPLSDGEKKAFLGYLNEISAAGTFLQVVSDYPESLNFYLEIHYDPQVLNGEGTLLSGGGKPVENAIREYLENIPYAGTFRLSRCVDYIQRAPGVRDVALASADNGGNPLTVYKGVTGFFDTGNLDITYTASLSYD
ncbi:MAG: hypothetical protein LBL07_18640 [Tannerella sp.]|jgi:hypothetical protein|nr:hypothetical protein [Tannerella sp.]